jgi:CxxC motif-containing protein (DUF1111 family)
MAEITELQSWLMSTINVSSDTQRRRLAKSLVTSWTCLVVFAFAVVLTSPIRSSAQAEFRYQFKPVLPSNGDSCNSCHSVPTIGGSSKVTVPRAQKFEPGISAGNSNVLHSRPQAETAPSGSFEGQRLTIPLMGDAYIEVLDQSDVEAALARQRKASAGKISGRTVRAPTLESLNSATAIGKFGWKAQHSSLYSACADSMLQELGIPNWIYPVNATPRDQDNMALHRIVQYIRSLPPPGRDRDLAHTEDAVTGEETFSRIGCALCHAPTMKTLPAGTSVNGGTYRVPKPLGSKEFHPYSDFLLHDIGTGDGIIEAATPEFAEPTTANLFRTPPLWGLRFRTWLMHDGKSVTLHQAIMRHSGEASDVVANYERLTPQERHELDQFLNSL